MTPARTCQGARPTAPSFGGQVDVQRQQRGRSAAASAARTWSSNVRPLVRATDRPLAVPRRAVTEDQQAHRIGSSWSVARRPAERAAVVGRQSAAPHS